MAFGEVCLMPNLSGSESCLICKMCRSQFQAPIGLSKELSIEELHLSFEYVLKLRYSRQFSETQEVMQV